MRVDHVVHEPHKTTTTTTKTKQQFRPPFYHRMLRAKCCLTQLPKDGLLIGQHSRVSLAHGPDTLTFNLTLSPYFMEGRDELTTRESVLCGSVGSHGCRALPLWKVPNTHRRKHACCCTADQSETGFGYNNTKWTNYWQIFLSLNWED